MVKKQYIGSKLTSVVVVNLVLMWTFLHHDYIKTISSKATEGWRVFNHTSLLPRGERKTKRKTPREGRGIVRNICSVLLLVFRFLKYLL